MYQKLLRSLKYWWKTMLSSYTAAQTHMDNMSAAYGMLLEEFNKACS